MCKYYLQGRCFHPKRGQKGHLAVPCSFHKCDHCTDNEWQQDMVKGENSFYEELLRDNSESTAALKEELLR